LPSRPWYADLAAESLGKSAFHYEKESARKCILKGVNRTVTPRFGVFFVESKVNRVDQKISSIGRVGSPANPIREIFGAPGATG